MDDFSSKPGVPNMYGLIQGPANAIGPGKRPLSAMTPTIVLKNGKLFLVLGSPGGPTIITTVANVLMGVVDYGLNIRAGGERATLSRSVDARPDRDGGGTAFRPTPSAFWSTWDTRSKMAHGYWGDAECIAIDEKTGELLGASDGRNNGKAVGY